MTGPADPADRATQVEELHRAIALLRRMQMGPPARGDGICIYCGESTGDFIRRWCGAPCRDAWEREQ